MLTCDVSESGESVTLRLAGRLDRYAGVDRILITLEPYLSAEGVEQVVLDLTGLEDLDSRTKSALPGLKLEAKARGKTLSVVGTEAERTRTGRTESLSKRMRL